MTSFKHTGLWKLSPWYQRCYLALAYKPVATHRIVAAVVGKLTSSFAILTIWQRRQQTNIYFTAFTQEVHYVLLPEQMCFYANTTLARGTGH